MTEIKPYVSMLDKDNVVRVREQDGNSYDRRGWNTEQVLTERWRAVDELRAETLRTVARMQAEMDAIEAQLDKKQTGKSRRATA